MELRAKETTLALLIGLALLTPAFGEQEFRHQVRHGHSKTKNAGTLTITGTGLSFERADREGGNHGRPDVWRWSYQDIQQLKVAPKSLTVLTYKDNKWKLGADRQYEFKLVSEDTFQDVYPLLKSRLDQRFVAVLAEDPSSILWEIPVKHLLRIGGDEGVLRVGADAIVYASDKNNESRTWRYQDIENVSSSGPFQLTVTTFERAKSHYGDLKGFNFELKERLEEARYNDLWLRLNESKSLRVLGSYGSDPAGSTGNSNPRFSMSSTRPAEGGNLGHAVQTESDQTRR